MQKHESCGLRVAFFSFVNNNIKVKLLFLLAAIIMENVKFYPYLGADYVKYMLKRFKNGFLSIFFERNIPSYEKNE